MQIIRGRVGWRATIGAATVMIAVGAGQTAFGAAAAPTSQATITLDGAHPAGRLPAGFVGLSYEERELGVGNFDATKGNLVNLFRTLGRSTSVSPATRSTATRCGYGRVSSRRTRCPTGCRMS